MKIIKTSNLSWVAASHEDVNNPGVYKKVVMGKSDFMIGSPQMINLAKLPAGNSFALHYHTDMQEIFIITRGKVVMTIRDEGKGKRDEIKIEIKEGDVVVVDPGERHLMRNETDQEVDYIVFGMSGNKNGKTVVVGE